MFFVNYDNEFDTIELHKFIGLKNTCTGYTNGPLHTVCVLFVLFIYLLYLVLCLFFRFLDLLFFHGLHIIINYTLMAALD